MWKVNYILLQTMKTDNKTDANCGAGRNCLFFRRHLNSPTGFCEIRFVPSLALLCAMFLFFFFLPLYCLSLFHSKNLITPFWYIQPFRAAILKLSLHYCLLLSVVSLLWFVSKCDVGSLSFSFTSISFTTNMHSSTCNEQNNFLFVASNRLRRYFL